MAACVVAAAAVLAFLPALDAEPVLDDVPILGKNPVLARGEVREILTTGWWNAVGNAEAGLYRPVTMLSFVSERAPEGGVVARRAHATNLLLHAAGAVALGFLLLRLGASRIASWSAALLFAVHPVHVQPVSELVGRAEILALLFTLLALLAWTGTAFWEPGISWRPAVSPWRARVAAWGCALAVFGAVGSKEVAAGIVLLIPALDWLFRPPRRDDLRPWAIDRAAAFSPVILALLTFVILRTTALETFPGLARVSHFFNPLVTFPQPDRTWTALAVLGRYVLLLLAPVRLGAEYAGSAVTREGSLLAPLPMLGASVLAGLLVLVAISSRRGPGSPRVFGFAALLFLIPYAIVGNLVFPIGVSMALRLLHLPAAGAIAIAGLGLGAWASLGRRARIAVFASMTVLVVAFAARSFRAAEDWQSEATLWAATSTAAPDNPTPHFLRARRSIAEGRLEEGERDLDRVLALWPDTSAALYEKGVLRARQGDLDGAAENFRKAVHLNPWHGRAQADLGIALYRLGRVEEAERRLRYAMRNFPDLEGPVSELAALCFADRRYAESAALYRKALALGRTDLESAFQEARRRAAEGEVSARR